MVEGATRLGDLVCPCAHAARLSPGEWCIKVKGGSPAYSPILNGSAVRQALRGSGPRKCPPREVSDG